MKARATEETGNDRPAAQFAEPSRPHLRRISGSWYCFTRPMTYAIGKGDTPEEALDDYELRYLGVALRFSLPDRPLLKQAPAG